MQVELCRGVQGPLVVHIKTIQLQVQLLNNLLQLRPHLAHHPSNLMVYENRNVKFIALSLKFKNLTFWIFKLYENLVYGSEIVS